MKTVAGATVGTTLRPEPTGCTRPAVEMPGLNSAVYQISSVAGLPSVLPQMLKEFAKAAIRTQPHDLLVWSRDYFRSLSSGTHPPEKERWEDSSAAGGITTGLLRLLNKQLIQRPVITLSDVVQHWNALGLDKQRLQDLLELLSLGSPETPTDAVLDWNKLLALAAGQLGDSLAETMNVLCQILSSDPDGGSSMDAETFMEMYCYLARIDGDIPEDDIQAVVQYVANVAQLQNATVNQFNLKSQLCPNLH